MKYIKKYNESINNLDEMQDLFIELYDLGYKVDESIMGFTYLDRGEVKFNSYINIDSTKYRLGYFVTLAKNYSSEEYDQYIERKSGDQYFIDPDTGLVKSNSSLDRKDGIWMRSKDDVKNLFHLKLSFLENHINYLKQLNDAISSCYSRVSSQYGPTMISIVGETADDIYGHIKVIFMEKDTKITKKKMFKLRGGD
jgi:hypothetical protein